MPQSVALAETSQRKRFAPMEFHHEALGELNLEDLRIIIINDSLSLSLNLN